MSYIEKEILVEDKVDNFLDKSIQVGSDTIHYSESGSNNKERTIIFIHGAFVNGESMKPLANNFANTQNIVINLPGHFGTSDSASKKSVHEYTDKVENFIKILQKRHELTDDITLVGWSMGGSISQDLATRNITEIKRIVLVNSSAVWDTVPTIPREFFDFAGIMATAGLSPTITQEEKEYILNEITPKITAPLDASMDDLTAVCVFDIRERIKDINIPVLIISGSADPLAIMDHQNILNETIPNTTMKIYENRSHALILESPKMLAKDILNFIDRTK